MFEIENAFKNFKNKLVIPLDLGVIDYIGINIAESDSSFYEFKAYYSEEYSLGITHSFIDFLLEKEMLYYREKVNNEKNGIKRIDIALKNRNNKNILSMFEWLKVNTSMFSKIQAEVKRLAQMKITELKDFDYSSLYHVSFVAQNEKIKVIKFHFLNRMCQNPEVPGINIRYNNEYYLDYLSMCNLLNFDKVLNAVNLLIKNHGGNLWMTGVDYTENGNYLKYKIYIKNISDFYGALKDTFLLTGFNENSGIIKKIKCVEEWNKHHIEFICVGVAIGVDVQDEFIVNYYFQYDEKLFN
ncbi:MAG: hypothetical protein Q4D76_19980 [Oscillospiraceae bacterium]|nr:hypothetical protein [Oscillospiraceae bacterium]